VRHAAGLTHGGDPHSRRGHVSGHEIVQALESLGEEMRRSTPESYELLVHRMMELVVQVTYITTAMAVPA
jgi:hypothetical protein